MGAEPSLGMVFMKLFAIGYLDSDSPEPPPGAP